MPTPVTDPNLLSQLEGGGGSAGGRPVTDPDLLAQLEGGAASQKPFLEKLGNFASKVWNDPPPSIAAARDVIKALPGASQELTWGADPQAAEQAAGTVAQAAQMGLGFRGLGGEGVFGRQIAKPGTVPMPKLGPIFAREAASGMPTAAEEAIAAAGRGGYTLPGYVATEGTVIPQVASSLKNVPWGGQPIVRTHDELLANMGRSASEIVPAAGTPETAGERAKTGLAGFIKTESQKPISEAYRAVDDLIDPNIRVPLENTRETIGQIMAERTRARIPGQSKAVQTVFDAVQDPRGMDYAGTKSLRSFLGEKSPMELASQGIAPTEVKRIYAAMSKDLGNVVREAGGPEALLAWKEANALTRLTKLQQQALSKVVGAEGQAAPEQVFNRLMTYANSKAGADLNRLRLAKKAMGPDAWSEVGSALIARLGRAPDESFSPQRFVTAFGNMAPAARNELFSGQQQAALADLFTVSKHIQDRITRFGNPSGTARGGIIGQAITGGGLLAEPISTLTSLVGARVASEVLARPAVVRAATRVARASLTGNPVAKERALAALRAVVQAEGLLPKQPQQDQPIPRQAGGPVEEDQPYLVGERGPEVIVPDRPGTVVPQPSAADIQRYLRATTQDYPKFGPGGIPVNPEAFAGALQGFPESSNVEDRRPERAAAEAEAARAAAAARTGRRGRTEGAGTRFVEGGYGIPSLYNMLDQGAQKAFAEGGKIQHYGNEYYDPAPVVAQAIGAAGAPLVAPAMEGAVLGAGAIRRAAIPQVSKRALQEAPYPQYAEQYPPTAPPVLKTDPKSGKEYLGKVASPEAEEFIKTREGVIADMKQGYDPYYDPAKRTSVDPSNYPGRNVDTLTLQPAMQKTIDKYMEDIGAPITRERLRAAYENGKDLGNAHDWYFMGQLEKDFVKELGPKEGRKAFLDRFASGMAATTSGNNPTTNLLMSHYLNYLEQTGKPMPTAGHQLPSPVGGRYGMSNVEDYMRMREAGGYSGLGENQPKMHNFARSFIGDLDRAVMDDQMAKGMLGHAADPNLPDRARKQAFGLLEAPLHAEAAAAGVKPGAYQDVAWAGFKNEPGKPMISHINDAIERTSRLTGMSREEVVRRGLIRNEIPLYGFSAPIPSVNSE